MIFNLFKQRLGRFKIIPYLCFMKTKVYILKDPTNEDIRYVGITTKTLEERLKGHLNDVKTRPDLNYHKINWIKKLQKGGKIPIIEQIDELDTLEEAKEKEIEYIEKYKKEYNLTNCTLGGDFMGFKAHSREVILKKKNTRPITQYDIFGGKIADFEITEDAVVLVYNKGLKNKDIKAAEMVLEENHDLAIAKWKEYFGSSVEEGGENED